MPSFDEHFADAYEGVRDTFGTTECIYHSADLVRTVDVVLRPFSITEEVDDKGRNKRVERREAYVPVDEDTGIPSPDNKDFIEVPSERKLYSVTVQSRTGTKTSVMLELQQEYERSKRHRRG